MYLHNDKNAFSKILENVSLVSKIQIDLVEKDYYVTLILKELASASDKIVFKGGTSLSKARRVINRFSEDVDISFTEHIGASRRKNLKYNIIAPIAQKLGLVISNFEKTQSDRDVNSYAFEYNPLFKSDKHVDPTVKVETSLITAVFPCDKMSIGNYIADYSKGISLSEYGLEPFTMKVQALERTMVDKVFAICDYYLEGQTERHSRHLYDIAKLLPLVPQDDIFNRLMADVRKVRQTMGHCPSADTAINIPELLNEIIDNEAYRHDYETLTRNLLGEPMPYDEAIIALKKIASSCMF